MLKPIAVINSNRSFVYFVALSLNRQIIVGASVTAFLWQSVTHYVKLRDENYRSLLSLSGNYPKKLGKKQSPLKKMTQNNKSNWIDPLGSMNEGRFKHDLDYDLTWAGS